MHYRCFVTFDRDDAQTSEAARRYVYDWLNDNSFVYTDTRFSGGWADWFVIGGRWSGELADVADEERERRHNARFESPQTMLDDTYGHEDDAAIVTDEIYERCLKQYEGIESDDGEGFINIDQHDAVSPVFVGTKWIVVVDYHT